MITPAPQRRQTVKAGFVPGRPARRKLAVEIYFLLYLSAIVLLLGTSPARHGTADDQETADAAIAALLTPDFRLSAERIQLLHTEPTAQPASSISPRLDRRDTVNGITAHGRFSSVQFRILAIEDSTGGGTPPGRTAIAPDAPNHARFSWLPPKVSRPTSWHVRVEGIAQPLPPPAGLDPLLRQRTIESLRRHGPVRDTVEFSLTAFPAGADGRIIAATIARADSGRSDSAANAKRLLQSLLPTMPPGSGQSFSLSLNSAELRVPPGREWRNVINIFGLDASRVTISAPGTRIVARSATSIELAGTAPGSGSQTVTVEATAPGVPSASARFEVLAAPMTDPILPDQLIAGQLYTLELGAQGMENSITVDVIEDGQTARSDAPPTLRYIPPATGKRVTFVRKLRGATIGRYESVITPLESPQIIEQQRSSDRNAVIVTTLSYGNVNGRPNLAQLKVDKGDVDDPVEIGSAQIDRTTLRIIQHWRVPLRSPQARRQQFQAWVIDQRGSKAGGERRTISVPE